ncbi:MAG: 16S rRNA (cytosine(1402)-N(4))-methyltransferase RsmH [Clostridia bacterium]|nr:16S rRNA (cytosine(1402)-N(4))-methyltransferase RsmH [Clostridia bacterium]MBQ1933794.1 16S rRNA (cytosine(1402)-N(4))-methyltransferase RsmH [Clostridia bacterium]MBQ5809897.1 16S rRNA (cytosine(1402)-N(4))-methyltransferase RsmH [Clostridia bacterium]MBR0326840.1 16S rRNA (cytosine(1402)-N(4))-methyltransferase RsmH [Clostridia bacterium]
MEEFVHVSVLLEEAVDLLDIKPDGIYVDCTAGGGGHSSAIAARLTTGHLYSFDQDEDAVRAASERLAPFGDRVTVIRENFRNAAATLRGMGIDRIDGATADLGVSSYQLDNEERGFSYMADAPLDMRMDRRGSLTARDVVNNYPEEEIARILFAYGEEKFSRKIAAAIVREREAEPIENTLRLSEIIKNAIPAAARNGGHHPAKRSFQAIRIEVNSELSIIEPAIKELAGMLNVGGRISIITFHSLEDRAVKNAFAELASGCVCPPNFPVCVCGKKPQMKIVTKKPVLPADSELEINPRARSAKLRAAEKL